MKKKEVYCREPRWLYIIAILIAIICLVTKSMLDDIFVIFGFLLIAIIQNETKKEKLF